MDYAALKTELTTDPKGLGYAASLASTNDVATAVLINATTGPGAAVVPLVSLSHDDFALLIAPVVMYYPRRPLRYKPSGHPCFNCSEGSIQST